MGVIELKPEVFSNPKKGKKIFAALVQILETQQSQLETLADERKRQEERIKVEYERWISGVRSLKGLIDQLRSQTKLSEMARLVEAAKTNLVFGLKMKQELVYKLKLDNSEDELADFKEWFDILCHRCPTEKECPERVGEIGSSKAAITKKLNCRALEKEVKRLKCEYEKLSIKNSSEVSALASEKEFAWNQYREMESKYNTQLQTKNDEVNQVNARVGKLLETVEQLQSSSMEKDAQIAELKASLAKMGAETSKKEGEVSRFLDGSNSLKKSKGGLLTPVLRGCTAGQKAKATSSDEKHGSGNTRFCTVEPKTKALSSDSEHASRKATRSRKRKPFSSQAAFLAMKNVGGKLLVFQSVLPSVGIAALSAREAEGRTSVGAGEKEAHKLLQPQDKTLKEMAIEFAEFQVCVDVFLTTQSYADVASISVVPSTTGGQVYRYFPFSAVSDTAKLFNDLRWNVTRPQGFEAVMRVRCSQGLQVQEYYGNFCKRIPTDVDLPGIDCDKNILVTLKLDDKLQEGSECAFQCALLYTTVYGQRRIRVTNISLPCTSMLTNLFRSADLDAQFACFLKQAIEIPTTPLLQVRDQLTNHCITILHSYRKFCATVSSSGQLILPEALKLFPLYTLALIKSTGLRNDGRVDDRSWWVNYVSSVSVPLVVPLVYPRMISVHDLASKEIDQSVIPIAIPLSSEHISDEGIYLLENGMDALIYVGNSVDPQVVQQLFGASRVDEIPTQLVLQQYDNPLSKRFNEVINEIRRQRCSYLSLKLCKKGDPSGILFFSYMVEDKSSSGLSYVEFLVHVHPAPLGAYVVYTLGLESFSCIHKRGK